MQRKVPLGEQKKRGQKKSRKNVHERPRKLGRKKRNFRTAEFITDSISAPLRLQPHFLLKLQVMKEILSPRGT